MKSPLILFQDFHKITFTLDFDLLLKLYLKVKKYLPSEISETECWAQSKINTRKTSQQDVITNEI
jgi:hypothetical protein